MYEQTNDSAGGTALQLSEKLNGAIQEVTPGPRWDEAQLPDANYAPDLSVDILPPVLKIYAEEITDSIQTPTGLAVMTILPAIATCIQNKFQIRAYGNFIQPLNIWTLSAMASGSGKSPVFNPIARALIKWEESKEIELKPKIGLQKSKKKILEKQIEDIEQQIVKAKDGRDQLILTDQLAKLHEDLAKISSALVAPRLFTSDVTNETFLNLLSQHGSMSVLSSEGGIFPMRCPRFSRQLRL